MQASEEDIRKLAQVSLRDGGFYSGDIDGIWGSGSNEAFTAYMAILGAQDLEIGGEASSSEEPAFEEVTGVVVLDPGHGGDAKVGGSSANNATSASGVLEKKMTLDLARAIEQELNAISAQSPGTNIAVHLTRTGDTNLGLASRARLAAAQDADVFLSIHYNGFNKRARGTETWILSTAKGNVNEAEDRGLAQRVQENLVAALKQHDAGAKDRGVKNSQGLGVLKDVNLGNTHQDHPTRACLVEVEFIDVQAVDDLLNGPHSAAVNGDIARAIAEAIASDLAAHA